MEQDSKNCPECGEGYSVDRNQKLDEDCPLDFTMDLKTGVFSWECFECNHEWKEKDGKIIT